MLSAEDMQFIEQLFRSLESEMRQGFAAVNTRLDHANARIDQTNARMERIGGLVNGGARAIAKLVEWSERTDVSSADLLRRVADMEERLRKLEQEKK